MLDRLAVLTTVAAAALLAVCTTAAESTDNAIATALADPAAAKLAKPTPGQVAWADMEREMFLCFDPCTWQGRDYDNHTTRLSDMNPEKLDAEQYAMAAKSWGAGQIVLVCKHTGSFCWWPTDTTDYCVKNISWKHGKGNLVKEVADACRKHGLKIGVYIYSDDPKYAKGIGRGGRTDNPKKQKEWNAKLRRQWTEVLTICGPDLVHEVWFDGGCIVPLKDIIGRLAPKAQIFGGPFETIRWPGTESGKLPYPCWSTLSSGVESTGKDRSFLAVGNPDGGHWAAPECDTVLYGNGTHKWFWSPDAEKHRRTLDDLMDIYLKSVGRGGSLLLNSTPNTSGRIPEGDMKLYRAFGAEIQRRFGAPLARTQGVGDSVELDLGKLRKVNQAWIMEDTRGGHRIRGYLLEGRIASGNWRTLATGISVGHKRIDVFPETQVDKVRLRITQRVGTPIVRELAAFYAENTKGPLPSVVASPKPCGKWPKGATSAVLDLTRHIPIPATYEVTVGNAPLKSVKLLFNGIALPEDNVAVANGKIIFRQTQQVTRDTKTALGIEFARPSGAGEARIRMISE